MPTRRYPILVERFKGKQAATVVCEACGRRRQLTGEECSGEVGYMIGERLRTHEGCGGKVVYAYECASRCGGCRKLGHFEKELDYCCSRACMLQKRYYDGQVAT